MVVAGLNSRPKSRARPSASTPGTLRQLVRTHQEKTPLVGVLSSTTHFIRGANGRRLIRPVITTVSVTVPAFVRFQKRVFCRKRCRWWSIEPSGAAAKWCLVVLLNLPFQPAQSVGQPPWWWDAELPVSLHDICQIPVSTGATKVIGRTTLGEKMNEIAPAAVHTRRNAHL